jgi:hypothetical protein
MTFESSEESSSGETPFTFEIVTVKSLLPSTGVKAVPKVCSYVSKEAKFRPVIFSVISIPL